MTRKIGLEIIADLKVRSAKGLLLAKQLLQSEKMDYPKLYSAFEHYIEHWNEFTHLGLFSIACEAVDGDPEKFTLAQAALAMMTAAFDIHDDIIDKSEEKQKIPTVFGKFGTEIALLLGNAFLIKGFETFADSIGVLPEEKRKRVFETMKKLLFEMGNAHALEIGAKKKKNITPKNYLKITEMKAAGLQADMYLGAFFGGGEEDDVNVLMKIGKLLGTLATLRNDLVDVFDIEELSQRISVNDLTIPVLFAMQDSKTKKQIAFIISKSRITNEDVAELVDITLETPSVIDLKRKMQILIGEGIKLTNRITKVTIKKQLQAIFSYMLEEI